jgi:hypothetical protein
MLTYSYLQPETYDRKFESANGIFRTWGAVVQLSWVVEIGEHAAAEFRRREDIIEGSSPIIVVLHSSERLSHHLILPKLT